MKNVLFQTGVFLILVGAGVATFATFLIFFYFLPLWVFLIGVLLVWLSNKKTHTKLFWSLTPVAVFLIYLFIWRQINTAPPETFLIANEYRGKIRIHFNEPCGQPIEELNGRRIYRVNNTGVLLSQFNDKQGFIDQQYFLIDKNDTKRELMQLNVQDYNEEWTTEKNPKEPSRNLLGIFHAGRVYSDGTYEFYVCTYNELRDSLDFAYDKQFDKREQKLLDECKSRKR